MTGLRSAALLPVSRIRGRLAAVIVLVGVLVTLASAAGAAVPAAEGARLTGDEPHYLLTALSLAEDRDLNIADELAERRYQPFHHIELQAQGNPLSDGRRLSPHEPLLPLLLALPVAVGGWLAAKIVLAVTAGVLAGLLVWTAVRRFQVPLPVAAITFGLFGLSPPLAVYGSQVYPELPAALTIAAGIALLTGGLGRGARWGLLAAVVVLPWLSTKYVPVAA